MSVTVTEITSSREHNGNPADIDFNVTLKYAAQGSDDDQAVLTAILTTAPATYTANGKTLVRNTVRLSPEYVDTAGSKGVWFADVQYITPQQFEINTQAAERIVPIPEDKIPTIRRSGGISPVQVRRTFSRQTLQKIGTDATDFKGAIEVDESGIQGVDIFSGSPTFTLRKRYTLAEFVAGRNTWQRYAEPAHVNSATFEGYAAGEVLYLGCDYEDDFEYDADTDTLTIFYWLTFSFAVSRNGVPDISSDNTPAGSGALPSKAGWDYLWIHRERPDPENEPNNVIPKGLYYERVYPAANFVSDIGLPS